MNTRYYVSPEGKFLGGFDGVDPPDGSIEIQDPPDDGSKILFDGKWVDGVETVPPLITSGQGKEALYNAGLFDDVETAIESIDDPDTKWRTQNAWDNRPTWERQSPFVLMMAGILGLDDEHTDQLFIDAAKL